MTNKTVELDAYSDNGILCTEGFIAVGNKHAGQHTKLVYCTSKIIPIYHIFYNRNHYFILISVSF